jgi:predicted permease
MQELLYQGAVMLVLIGLGMLCAKIGLLTEKSTKELSTLLLQIVNPVLILLSYQKEYKPEYLRNLLFAVLISALTFAASMIIGLVFFRKREGREAEIERFSVMYSNCAFMGIPLINALYGAEGVFYLTAYLTVFNLLVWSHGVILMSGERSFRSVVKVFYSTTMIAIYIGLITFFGRITLPVFVTDCLGYIGSLNTPLAMLVAGGTVYRSDILKALKNIRVYLVTAVKLLLVPLAAILICLPFGIDRTVLLTIIVAASAPSATMCTLFSIRYDRNTAYASEIFALTTVLSVVTMPLMVKVYDLLSGLI